ncbi:MAG: hypothetical protein QXJ14_02680 [Candidatus Aenigmatarchaeota archaeon]
MYNISNRIIENILREIESKLSENEGEYKISISDLVIRYNISISTSYTILRLIRKIYENNSKYDVNFIKSELIIKIKDGV